MHMTTQINKLLLCSIILAGFFTLSGCASSASETAQFSWAVDLNANQKTSSQQGSRKQQHVILLHGMYRSSVAMRPVDKFLINLGYTTSNISYPSTEFEIETLVRDFLEPEINKFKGRDDVTLHFATHSMGGILVRYYLQQNSISNLGNVVMIAPPNKGTPLADLFEGSEWVNSNSGPAKSQLSAEEDSWVNQLGAANFDVGIIAGDENNNIVTSMLLPGDDDGVVSVESTKLERMRDFITIPAKHYRLRSNIAVLQQVAHFLRYGVFFRSSDAITTSI